jgi:hypothetical protein
MSAALPLGRKPMTRRAYNNRGMDRVYLDMCSLKRPFDDQRQPRIREKAAAVAGIMAIAGARSKLTGGTP